MAKLLVIESGCLPWRHDWKISWVTNPLPYSVNWNAGARTLVAVKCRICASGTTFALRQKYTRRELDALIDHSLDRNAKYSPVKNRRAKRGRPSPR